MLALPVLSGCSGAEEGTGDDVSSNKQAATGTTTFHLTALASGNWNSAGVHTVGQYQIGHSTEHPDQQAAYFEFDFDPIKGRTVTAASVLIPGSTDYNIETVYAPKCGTKPCFKVGIAPQGAETTEAIVSPSSNHNTGIYLDGSDGNRNQDLGYAWPEDGLHKGLAFDADHYVPARLQDEVNAGGNWVFWARDDFDTGEKNVNDGACPACPGGVENYIWGSTAFTTGIVANITVEN
jgi:hypothetical protein